MLHLLCMVSKKEGGEETCWIDLISSMAQDNLFPF